VKGFWEKGKKEKVDCERILGKRKERKHVKLIF
jgi:hypothetical protein